MKRFLLAAAFFAVLLLLWEAAFRARIWSPVLLPSPWQVASYLKNAAVDGTLAKATVITMRRLLAGYLIGLVVGLPLGLLTARWKLFRDTIGTMALAHGSGNFCDDPYRLRPRPTSPLRSRVECDGSSHRDHACDRCHRPARG